MHVYDVKNDGVRPQGFKVRGGVETVKAGETRTLALAVKPTDEVIEAAKERGVTMTPSDKKVENEVVSLGGAIKDRVHNQPTPAENPAETGGVVPQSSVSEQGGVDRKPGDTTTTTKPTEKQTGAKA